MVEYCHSEVRGDDRIADKACVVQCLFGEAKLTRLKARPTLSAVLEAEEREDLILELQNAITDLHQEMSLKEQQELHKLQHLLQLETRVKELQEQTQSSEETIAQLRQELNERTESNSALQNV
ncbi:putative coiled-coil domain-containing protein 19 [Triplophysa rosa]|uniref:Coiled-coil domain-containing protein 19 n=1 Tax=Triplophysa rosa TaxID=992332 RepID=A0A9W7X3M6_TRIRA|nr:putative coiled-coil domain-containing protein 19 [Triplophysa rosa]